MFRRHSILVAVVAAAAACDAPQSTTPRGPGAAAATKQGSTSSQMLLQIALANGASGQYEVFGMDDGGTNLVRLTYEPATDDGQASWAPDGKGVLFARFYGDPSAIFVMEAGGTGPDGSQSHSAHPGIPVGMGTAVSA